MTRAALQTCETCGGTGWLVQRLDAVESVAPCPQCRSAARVRRLLAAAEIPPRYLDRGFEVYSTHHPKQEAALKRCIDFVEKHPDNSRGLLLAGPCGVGKTHLCVAVLRTILEEKPTVGRFVDETELLRRLHYSYDRDSPETEREVLRPLMDADLLVWDDLGTGRPTDWARETISTVINYRYTYKKLTLFTTNRSLSRLPPESAATLSVKREQVLEENIGRRLFSRIMEMCEIVEVDGPDARTEIHKAGQDFQKASRRAPERLGSKSSIVIPTGLILCPRCQAPRVTQQDLSREKRSEQGTYVEVACFCQACQAHFLARFYPRRGRLEYPSQEE